MKLAEFLGKHVSSILQQSPFKYWPVDRFVENSLDEQIIQYIFNKHGLELQCNYKEEISVIFLYSEDYNGFDDSLFDIPFSSKRKQILEWFGMPSKSGERINDPILGEIGAWDRFTLAGFTLHFSYRIDSDEISRITLMKSDVVP
jgi:hypothetical protein